MKLLDHLLSIPEFESAEDEKINFSRNIITSVTSVTPPTTAEQMRIRPAVGSQEEREQRGKAISCRYDWLDHYRGLRLHCTVHRHAAGTDTVFVTRWQGNDTLLEMAELGILTGRALEDARRTH